MELTDKSGPLQFVQTSFIRIQPHLSLIHCLCYFQMPVTETVYSAKPKICIMWYFTEKKVAVPCHSQCNSGLCLCMKWRREATKIYLLIGLIYLLLGLKDEVSSGKKWKFLILRFKTIGLFQWNVFCIQLAHRPNPIPEHSQNLHWAEKTDPRGEMDISNYQELPQWVTALNLKTLRGRVPLAIVISWVCLLFSNARESWEWGSWRDSPDVTHQPSTLRKQKWVPGLPDSIARAPPTKSCSLVYLLIHSSSE